MTTSFFPSKMFTTAVCCVVLLGAFMQCGMSKSAVKMRKAGNYREGWRDESTYRFISVGLIKPDTEGDPYHKRKTTACESALVQAQYQAIERLADLGLEKVKGTVKMSYTKDRVVKEVSGFIRGGTVIAEIFDGKNNVCYVVYDVSEKGLRKKVDDAASRAVTGL